MVRSQLTDPSHGRQSGPSPDPGTVAECEVTDMARTVEPPTRCSSGPCLRQIEIYYVDVLLLMEPLLALAWEIEYP